MQTGQGALVIENGISRTAKHIDNRDGGAFNITRSTLRENSEDTRVERSELKSEADLRLAGKNDITIAGSLIESAGTLKIDTLGDINVRAAQAQNSLTKQKPHSKSAAMPKRMRTNSTAPVWISTIPATRKTGFCHAAGQ